MLFADAIHALAAHAHILRGVYCLRHSVEGLWAYYAITSDGFRLHDPQPAEIGEATALLVAELADELDLVDPVTPLRLIRGCGGSSSASAWPRSEPPANAPPLSLLA